MPAAAAAGAWDRRWAAGFAAHLAVLGVLAAVLFGVRQHGGESRAVDASGGLGTIISDVVAGTGIGNHTVWRMCFRRGVQGLYDIHDRRPHLVWLVPAMAGAIALTVARSWRATAAEQAALAGDVRRAAAFAGAASLVAYAFCFAPPHFPPSFTEGRLTSTHLAATMPVAVAMAALAAVPVLVASTAGVPRWASGVVVAIVLGGYFACLFSVAVDEQDGYVALWQARRQFWTQVLDLCPDVGNRTIVVVDARVVPPAYFMGVTSWSDYMVLMQCYRVPGGHFRRDPMVFVDPAAGGDWRAGMVWQGDRVVWRDGPFGTHARDNGLDAGNLILLHLDRSDNRLTRVAGTVDVGGRPFRLKPLPAADVRRPPYPTLPLYGLLTGR